MLYQRELESINRAIKYATIANMSLSINYMSKSNTFNLEFVEPKAKGKSFKRTKVDPKHVHYNLMELIKEVQAHMASVKEDEKQGNQVLGD